MRRPLSPHIPLSAGVNLMNIDMVNMPPLKLTQQAQLERIWRNCLRPDSSVELRYLLRRHFWVFVFCVFASLSIAVAYIIKTPRLFTTHTQVLFDLRTPKPLPTPGNDDHSPRTLENPEIESQIEILSSTPLQAAVVKQYKLYQVPEFIADTRSPLRRLSQTVMSLFQVGEKQEPAPASPDAPNPADVRAAIDYVSNGLYIERVKLSYLIDISFTSRDPETSALISNAIAEAYINDQISTNAKIANAGAAWLEERIDQLRQKVNDASFKLQQFRTKRDEALSGQTSLDELESTVSAYKKLYEGYLQAFTDSAQREALPGAIGRIVGFAEVPLSPSHPRIPKILGASIIIGLLTGYAIAVARQYFDKTVRKPGQIAQSGVAYLGELRGLNEPGPMRLVPNEPLSQFSYDLRRLERNLSSARVPEFQSIGVTSISSRTHSNEITCNLAYFYAVAGKRVVVVDADLYRRRISRAFDLDTRQGLTDVIRGTAEAGDCIVSGAFWSVDLLPAGTLDEQNVDYRPFGAGRLRDRLVGALETYDVVIYDMPAAFSPVTLSFASVLDAVVILAEFGRTSLPVFAELAAALQAGTGKFVGAAIAVDRRSHPWPIRRDVNLRSPLEAT